MIQRRADDPPYDQAIGYLDRVQAAWDLSDAEERTALSAAAEPTCGACQMGGTACHNHRVSSPQ